VVVAVLFLLQAVVGGGLAHYRVEPFSFYGLDAIVRLAPYNLLRPYHLAAGHPLDRDRLAPAAGKFSSCSGCSVRDLSQERSTGLLTAASGKLGRLQRRDRRVSISSR